MGMPLELNTMIVTKGKEERISENGFVLTKSGYRIYPIDIPIDVKRSLESDSSGTAVIKKVEWEQDQTRIVYELVSLNSTN